MRNQGSILLILLIMLLFASAALLQLNEDNYLARLMKAHVENLATARHALSDAFDALSVSPEKNQACYSDANNKGALKDFWSSHPSLCRLQISGLTVDYVFWKYQQKSQEMHYLQYTLYIEPSYWLQITVEQASGRVVSWVGDVG